MANKTSKTDQKRPPKGQRTYERRMKQAARQEGNVYRSLYIRRAPAKIAGVAPTPVPGAPAGKVPAGE